MKKLLLLLSMLTLWSSVAVADLPDVDNKDLKDLKYGKLAKEVVYPLFKDLVDELEDFDRDTLPHEAKGLRKQLGNFRGYIDLFVYAYEDQNELVKLRDDLDQGYEYMGDFKDLFDIQGVSADDADYDDDEVKDANKLVRRWLDDFLKNSNLRDLKDLLRNPNNRIVDVDKDELSRFYWGGVDKKPLNRLKGIENISRLAKELLKLAEDDYEGVQDVEDIVDHDDAEAFHDFRKRVRSVLKIVGYFPHIVDDRRNKVEDAYDTLVTLVSKYGEVNDRITAYYKYQRQGKNRKARRAKNDAEELFEELNEWQERKDIDEEVETFLDALL